MNSTDTIINIEDINKFNNSDINNFNSDKRKKIIIFTGCTEGIGKATLIQLIKDDLKNNRFKFIIPIRNIEKGELLKNELKVINENVDILIMKMDLSSFASIREFVKEFNRLGLECLDVLVNCAGLMMTSYSTTIDGFETTFAVNHLGPFLLTNLLLDQLNKSEEGGNIVLVSSTIHEREKLDFNQLNVKENKFSFVSEYGKSKLCNILFARELQKRLDESGSRIKVNSIHPGSAKTSLSRDYNLFIKKIILPIVLFFIGNDIQEIVTGLKSIILNENNEKGKYFYLLKEKQPSPFACDFENSKKLYDESIKMVQL